MKHVGVNVAADPLFTAAYTGVDGGLVIVTADDPEHALSSQNEQDNRHYAIAAKIPMLEPADSAGGQGLYTKLAFESVRALRHAGLPAHDHAHLPRHRASCRWARSSRRPMPLGFVEDPAKWVMLPVNARKRHVVVEERLRALRRVRRELRRQPDRVGRPVAGHHHRRRRLPVRAARRSRRLGSEARHGPPAARATSSASSPPGSTTARASWRNWTRSSRPTSRPWASAVDRQGPSSRSCGELSPRIVRPGAERRGLTPLPRRRRPCPTAVRPNLCAGCPHRGLFYRAQQAARCTVTGDIGCYTLRRPAAARAPWTPACAWAPASATPWASRRRWARPARGKVVAVIGDSTFVHSGHHRTHQRRCTTGAGPR
ncbi:MAG: hypothetical protein M0C28_19335 [Candidatus Moduliflexus flocculans]|nr:hypothetical protein [Candidatus Moduliflexus flocculans]